jgi:hypothetical protein
MKLERTSGTSTSVGNAKSEPHTECLAPGKLFALQNVIELDGMVGSYPLSARGTTSINCYLLTEANGALLIDTGFACHEQAVLAQLHTLLRPDQPLSLFPLRINEFMSVGNALAVARHIGVDRCFSLIQDAALFMDVVSLTIDEIAESNRMIPTELIPKSGFAEIGKASGRMIEFVRPPLQLIPTRWMYDGATRTLFTSDFFTHVWRSSSHDGFIVNDANDSTSHDDVRSFLLNTRYWWLEGARTGELRKSLEAVFLQRDIETIAPGYGCILHGRATVERHYQMMDDVLAALDVGRTRSQYVHHMTER